MTGGQGSPQVAGSPGPSPTSVQISLANNLNNTKNTTTSTTNTTTIQTSQAVVMSRPAAVNPIPSSGATVPLQPGMQLVNMRPGQITTVQGRSLAPRMIVGQHMIQGVRHGQQPLTLQSVPGLPPGTRGHLLVKTETGQLQLLPVNGPTNGTPSTTASLQQSAVYRFQQPQTTIVSNSITTTTNTVQEQPAITVGGSGAATTIGNATISTNTMVQNPRVTVGATAVTPTSQPQVAQSQTPGSQIITAESAKTKCKNFLSTLLKLANDQRASVARNVRKLIQGLIDGEVEPEAFTEDLQQDLNSSPQPCLVPFLKKTLPYLRVSLAKGELTIDGVKPPPLSAVQPVPGQTTVIPTMTIVRPQNQTVPVRVVGQAQSPNVIHRPNNSISSSQTRVVVPQQVQQVKLGNKPLVTTMRASSPLVSANASTTIRNSVPSSIGSGVLSSSMSSMVKNSPLTANKFISTKEREKKDFGFSSYSSSNVADDDINDVAAMGGVNLGEESQHILDSTGFVGTQIRSCKDETFLLPTPLQQRIRHICSKHGLDEPPKEVLALISHATQERLKTVVEKLSVVAEHRLDIIKAEPKYDVTQDVKGQLRFLEELDKLEKKRKDEMEREMLLKAAKSRNKSEDPEQAKLKAKAKEMQRVEMEEMRQRDANLTAHKALQGPKKKPKLDIHSNDESSTFSGTFTNKTMPLRPRTKRVNLRDLMFLMEQEKELNKSSLLYRTYLK